MYDGRLFHTVPTAHQVLSNDSLICDETWKDICSTGDVDFIVIGPWEPPKSNYDYGTQRRRSPSSHSTQQSKLLPACEPSTILPAILHPSPDSTSEQLWVPGTWDTGALLHRLPENNG